MTGSGMGNVFNIGIDIGSTTVKIAVLEEKKLIYQSYERHYSDMTNCVVRLISECYRSLKYTL